MCGLVEWRQGLVRLAIGERHIGVRRGHLERWLGEWGTIHDGPATTLVCSIVAGE